MRISRSNAPRPRRRVTLVVDPRFSGGTSAAVAAEIGTLAPHVDLSVVAVETAMFSGRTVHAGLQRAMEENGIDLVWNPKVVRGDVVVIHNPSCLKFNSDLALRISCRVAVVVTHENFVRPNGSEGFDVGLCLDLIDRALVCGVRVLAPVSDYNRLGVAEWLDREGAAWDLAEFNWFNICDFEMKAPNPAPADRRGRHSRAGLEKFPPLGVMKAHFPKTAESCTILGGDYFLEDPDSVPAHWTVRKFGAMDVGEFLRELDFFVYFTHSSWRESFGRVIAEAIAAGKLVITDAGTARVFGDAVVSSDGSDVDEIVAAYVADPEGYVRFVEEAQRALERFRPERFVSDVLRGIERLEEAGVDAVL
ncbi:hypothetical protein [Amaricoccus tamworthensis]|uniref:hypothetical protein n=1 Tax=Amaricoccus tamworthensis TaxID=57002 RepID=UPI003C7DDB1A